MKRSLLHTVLLSLALVADLLLTVGCARTYSLQMKVVDSESRQSLAGVSALWREDSSYDLLTGRQHTVGPRLIVSDKDGLINIAEAHRKWASRIVFSRTGYTSLYGVCRPNSFNLSRQIMAPPNWDSSSQDIFKDIFILEDPITRMAPSNGCYLIMMSKD